MDMNTSVKVSTPYPPAPSSVSRTAEKPAQASIPDKVAATAEGKEANSETLKEAVKKLDEYVNANQRNLDFSIDEDSGKVVVKVIATSSGEVIRQLPSEEALKLAESLKHAGGALLDEMI